MIEIHNHESLRAESACVKEYLMVDGCKVTLRFVGIQSDDLLKGIQKSLLESYTATAANS